MTPSIVPLPGEFAFHHLGVACESVAAEMPFWQQLGYRPEGARFVDEPQGIAGLFMVGNGPRLELLEPTPGSQTLAPWLKRRIKFYHMGYLVPAFDAAVERLVVDGATVARSPMMSVYFGSRIAFFMTSSMALIELIEASPA